MLRRLSPVFVLLVCSVAIRASDDRRLDGAFKKPAEKGWVYIHVEGKPAVIGYQHGYLLSREIEDNKRAIELSTTHGTGKSWQELRAIARDVFWPKVSAEYKAEIEGIAAGLKAKGSSLDVDDLVAMNGYMEFDYYLSELKRSPSDAQGQPAKKVAERCSAFVATGSYTKNGKVVIGHNNWTDYLTASRWNVIFDIVPSQGHHILMDGMPGLIHSGDDFGINDAGLLITETTISSFHGFDPAGVPEFARARQAMQYAESIDDFARIMKQGNNGGYANTWLVADRKNNEIGRLELGLRNVTLDKTKDGYFVGSNFPINPKLISEETSYPISDPNTPNSVRHRRWDQLMAEYKGRIDVAAGEKFETDHYDVITHEIDPNERTICGHIDRSSRGLPGWQGPFAPAGVAQVKVGDADMASRMSFVAGMGHPCGVAFRAGEHLKAHPEYSWQAPELEDLKANSWSVVAATPSSKNLASSAGTR
jgi:hypothetical protein